MPGLLLSNLLFNLRAVLTTNENCSIPTAVPLLLYYRDMWTGSALVSTRGLYPGDAVTVSTAGHQPINLLTRKLVKCSHA